MWNSIGNQGRITVTIEQCLSNCRQMGVGVWGGGGMHVT